MTRAGFVAVVVAGVLAIGASAEPRLRGARASTSLDYAYAIAIQRDGKLVVAGRSASGRWTFALARYTVRGNLDARFGRRGRVRTAVGSPSYSWASAVGVAPGGKIVAAGRSGVYPNIGVARYSPRGRPDRRFGRAGQVVTKFGPPKGINAWARALAIQGDGKVVVAGGEGRLIQGPWRFALARYTNRGRLDPTFGRGGKAMTDAGPDGDAWAVEIQRDGKIVAAGDGFALVRYTTSGKLDPSFGAGGVVRTDFGPSSHAFAVAIQKDGKILVAGRATSSASEDFALARYTSDGTLDSSFGRGGKVVTNFGIKTSNDYPSDDWAYAVAVEPDGKIVLAGASDIRGNAAQRSGTPLYDFALVRYSANGSLDPSFGRDGKVLTPFDEGQSLVQDVAIQTDGKIVAVGGGAGYFDLARYTTDGLPDSSFGGGGKVITKFPSR
jgi:uncharacterized delta-60 repeat protein